MNSTIIRVNNDYRIAVYSSLVYTRDGGPTTAKDLKRKKKKKVDKKKIFGFLAIALFTVSRSRRETQSHKVTEQDFFNRTLKISEKRV